MRRLRGAPAISSGPGTSCAEALAQFLAPLSRPPWEMTAFVTAPLLGLAWRRRRGSGSIGGPEKLLRIGTERGGRGVGRARAHYQWETRPLPLLSEESEQKAALAMNDLSLQDLTLTVSSNLHRCMSSWAAGAGQLYSPGALPPATPSRMRRTARSRPSWSSLIKRPISLGAAFAFSPATTRHPARRDGVAARSVAPRPPPSNLVGLTRTCSKGSWAQQASARDSVS